MVLTTLSLPTQKKAKRSKRPWIGNPILDGANENACIPIQSLSDMGNSTIGNPVIVAWWDGCDLIQKLKNAERAGANMLVLVLEAGMDFQNDAIYRITLQTSVEVVAIQYEEGTKLMNVLRDNLPVRKELISSIELHHFYDPQRDWKETIGPLPVIEYWMTPNDLSKMSYDPLEEIEGILSDLPVIFIPHYFLERNEALRSSGFQTNDERCVSGGRYCDSEPKVQNRLFGKEVILEAMRQYCLGIFTNPSIPNSDWWKYIHAYVNECVDKDVVENPNCHEKAFRIAGVNQEIIDEVNYCMRESFLASENEDLGTTFHDNFRLEYEFYHQKRMFVHHLPSLYVNRELYTESLQNRRKLIEFICPHFSKETAPSICTGLIKHTWRDFMVYLGIFLGSVFLMAVVLYCVRRSVKREVMFRMKNEIDQIVTQYKVFKDKSDLNRGDDHENEDNDLRSPEPSS